MCVWHFFPEPSACVLHSGLYSWDLMHSCGPGIFFYYHVGNSQLTWMGGISLAFVSLLRRHIAQLLLEKECVWCIFFFFFGDLASVKISFSLSSYMIGIEFKVGNYFPWEFWRPHSILSASNFIIELLEAFLFLVILHVTFLSGGRKPLESFLLVS